MKIAVLFDNLGPYHKARLRACAGHCDLLAVEFGTRSGSYAWQNEPITGIRHAACNPDGPSRDLSLVEFRTRMGTILSDFSPDVVVIPGWGTREAFLAYQWCIKNRRPAIVMSESTAWDEPRVGWREAVKRRIVSLASTALVGGCPHQQYIQQLGMPPARVFQGYDVVDNEYFRKGRDAFTHASDFSPTACDANESACGGPPAADGVGRMRKSDPTPFFLASNRFIAKKNLFRLIEAYAMYGRDRFTHRSEEPGSAGPAAPDQVGRLRKDDPTRAIWHLCLLGDGELKPALIAQCHELGLTIIEAAPWESSDLITNNQSPITHPHHGVVWMPGFRQIDELPRFYAHAGAFVHASTTEQWGLVVNEAMASGLPVIVSNRVGCASDLVEEGRNGFTFDPLDVSALAGLMEQMAALPQTERETMGEASRSIIAHWGPDRFATGLMAAAKKAIEIGPKPASLLDRLLLRALASR